MCAEISVPRRTQCERGHAAMRVEGTLAPELVGVLVSLADPLADAEIPILAIGTLDTDYVLVREGISRALSVRSRAWAMKSTRTQSLLSCQPSRMTLHG